MAIALVFTIVAGFSASAFFYFFAKSKTEDNQAKNEINFLRLEKEKLEEKINILQQKNYDFEKQNELLKYAQQQLENDKEEWNKSKEVILFQLSEELMKKNNEQQNLLSLSQQENIRKITENLFKDFENVATKVATLNEEVKKSVDESALLKSALLSPGSAGRTAEITLENILKSSGLKEKVDLTSAGDYVLQSHFGSLTNSGEQESKRPDAILFFPNDQIAIIDSKSSPHFLELERARKMQDFEQEKIILSKIKDSFRRHLDSLRRKDYVKFLFEELHSKNQSDYKIFIIMFLQTEKMLEVIQETDPSFVQKALESGIIVVTPVGLINFLAQARFVIDRVRQEKNVEDLKIQVRKLLDNVALVFKESKEMGKSLNKALTSYGKLTKNLNRGVYSSIKNISDLGIEGKKTADLQLLEEYEDAEKETEEEEF
jgi:DNA recombination protein RmuC